MAKASPKPKRGDSRRGPGSRTPTDKAKERKPPPKEKSEIPAWIEECLEHTDPARAAIYRNLPTDPAEMFAYMTKSLVSDGVLMDELHSIGEIPLETAMDAKMRCFGEAAKILRLSRDAMNTSEFDRVEGAFLPPGKHAVHRDADGNVHLRLITTSEEDE